MSDSYCLTLISVATGKQAPVEFSAQTRHSYRTICPESKCASNFRYLFTNFFKRSNLSFLRLWNWWEKL